MWNRSFLVNLRKELKLDKWNINSYNRTSETYLARTPKHKKLFTIACIKNWKRNILFIRTTKHMEQLNYLS